MKLKKSTVCLIVAASLGVGSLAGCGAKDSSSADKKEGTKTAESAVPGSRYAYKPEFIEIKEHEITNVSGFCQIGDEILFIGDKVVGEKVVGEKTENEGTVDEFTYDVTKPTVFTLNPDSGKITEKGEFPKTEAADGYRSESYVTKLLEGDKNTYWVCENVFTYTYDFPEGVDENSENAWEYYVEGENYSKFRQFDIDGNEVGGIDTIGAGFQYGAEYVEMDSKGNIYMASWNGGVKIFDSEGKLKAEVDLDKNSDSTLYKLGEDKVGLAGYTEDFSKRYFAVIDPETGGLGEKLELPQMAYNIYGGFGDYDFLYDYSGKIYGYKESSKTSEKILDWFDYDINSDNIYKYKVLKDGRIIAYVSEWDRGGNNSTNRFVLMNVVSAAEVSQKEEIVVAGLYMSHEIKDMALKFNRTNDKYRIVLKDYSEFNTTDGDYTLGQTKLNTEIIAGQVPDVLVTSDLPLDKYGAKGLLENLWEYIDRDPQISRSDLMEDIFEVMSVDGKLYQVSDSFGIITAIANKDIWGEEEASVGKLLEKTKNLPEGVDIFSKYMTRDAVVEIIIYMNMDSLVDWNTGECNFDSPEFVGMLEFAKMFPETFDYETYEYEDENNLVLTGRQLLALTSIYVAEEFIQRDAIMGDKSVYVGAPGLEGGITGIFPGTGLAISSACKNKEAAWEFVRNILTEDYQKYTWSIPTNKNVFEDKIKDAMTEEKDGEGRPIPKYSGYINGQQFEFYAMTQEQRDKLMDIIGSANAAVEFDRSMQDIIEDELSGFFSGEVSAEDAAKLIQSRVSLYVSEQR